MDEESERFLHTAKVLGNVENLLLSIQIIRKNSLLQLNLLAHHVRGDLVTAILIFREYPDNFLQQLNFNREWNPFYLVLICLNEQHDTTNLLSFPVIQRSQFIFLLQESKKNKHQIDAFTSFPLQTGYRGKRLFKASLGVWEEDRFTTRDSVFPRRFENFLGHELQLSTWCDDIPLLNTDEDGKCIGQSLDTLDIVASKYNFTYDVQLKPEDGMWALKENGTWYGLLGGLAHGGKDLAINSIILNWETGHDFDFIYPYQTEGYGFMINMPPPLPSWRKVLYPFAGKVWIGVVLSAALAPSLLGLLARCFSLVQDPVYFAFKIGVGVLKQSVIIPELRAWWSRVWVGCWWIAALILCSVYTGNLVAVLTVPVYPKLISTLEELAESDIRIGMLDYGDFVADAMEVSNHSALSVLGKKLDLLPFYDEGMYDELVQLVTDRTHALLEAFSYLIYVQYSHNKTYTSYMLPDKIYEGNLCWYLPRNTPYTPVFNHAVTRLKETGVIGRIASIHLELTYKKRPVPRGGEILNLPQFQGPFLLWLLGCVIAGIIFISEFFTKTT